MITPDLPPQEPPRIRPAAEIHQTAPARDPEPLLSVLNEALEAVSKLQSSSLVSVLRTHNSSTAASVLEPEPETPADQSVQTDDDALAQAIAVVEESLASTKPRAGRSSQ